MENIFVDTHAHLYVKQFANDRQEMIERMKAMGVQKVFLPNIDAESISEMMVLSAQYPGVCYPMMGLHPCHVEDDYPDRLAAMRTLFDSHVFYGVGETGLDAYWDKTTLPMQEDAFRIQISWAIESALPLIIHSRETTGRCIDIVREMQHERLHGIFHCFSGTTAEAMQILSLGFKLGIGGVITYKNSGLAEAIREIPLSEIVLETDAPYLAPVPHRGKRNESAYLPLVAGEIAASRGISIEEVARVTTNTALRLFGLQENI